MSWGIESVLATHWWLTNWFAFKFFLQIIYSDTKVSETLPRVDGVLSPEKVEIFEVAVFKKGDT